MHYYYTTLQGLEVRMGIAGVCGRKAYLAADERG
jgi:hypothetical protein